MSEIPEDIVKTAHNAANGLPVGNNRQAIMAAIARAILAERKRCAEVARRMLVYTDTTSRADEEIYRAIMGASQ